jgi:23S rRNA (cytidine1920-2'-O)/16S rRNA (cytidine1409-2'-O)-methyltransferase
MRIDVFLTERGIVPSRSRAKELLQKGAVKLSGKTVTKPSYEVPDGYLASDVTIDDCENKYVGRGGYKLEHALNEFKINVSDKIALDIGASTGGFTDCLLKNGAKKVYAIDSGTAQLHSSLLNEGRVVSIENYNARYLKKEDFADEIDLVTIDVSFISQTLIIPKIAEILPKGASFVSLIKPQFEVGREQIGKKGIVKDESARDSAVKKVCDFAVSSGFELLAITQSPIHGGDGNIEFLAYFKRSEL